MQHGVDTSIDQALFADRERGRADGERRSLKRAAAFAPWLGIDLDALAMRHPPTVIVVGSKGKGTAAVYASATLASLGLRVGTLTSPGFRSNRERIRIDGRAIAPDAYEQLVLRVIAALDRASASLPAGGYLSPTGLFTLAAVRHFIERECDAWVLEAGMGGASDEVSLFTADVLAVTPVFAEHLGVIGGTVAEIATDKLGAAGATTQRLLSAPQAHPEAARALDASRVPVDIVTSAPVDGVVWPAGLSRVNAWAGVRAAVELARARGIAEAPAVTLRDALAAVRVPGRLSVHRRGEQQWVVDAAANSRAVRAALQWCHDHAGVPSSVLLCVPDGKDNAGCAAALDGEPAIAVRSDAAHLSFAAWGRTLPSLSDLALDQLGPLVLALGTISFVGEVLAMLGVDTEVVFAISPRPGSTR